MIDDRRKILRQDKEAVAWFTLLSDTEVEADDLERFDRWIQRDGNRAAYRRIEDISSAANRLRDEPDLRAAAREALGRQRRPAAAKPPRRPLSPRWAWSGLGLAALAATALVIVIFPPPKTYRTAVGGRMTAQLTDGSTVQLNTDTTLRVRFAHGQRRLELIKGQAFFDVAHDAARPFLVRAGAMEVRAVGTRFDVRHDGPAASVVLAEGKVRVSPERPGTSAWTLIPGQALTVRSDGRSTGPARVDVAALTGWTHNLITFHDIALAEAVAEMNRYAPSKISLAPGVPAQAKLSGVFSTSDPAEFLDAAKASFDLESRRKPDGGVELRPRSNGS